jgi:HD-GYP domain-containing protein (c-di-GMP phosphodiesterase class II)
MSRCWIGKDDVIKRTHTPQGSAIILNKYKHNQLEVNIYEIEPDFVLYFQPPELEGALKTYWILKGKIQCVNENRVCSEGDMIILNSHQEPYHFSALEHTTVLVHSINDDSFSRTERNFDGIYKVLMKIQEKDSYTLDHSYNVHRLVEKMGVSLGYKGHRMLNLLLAAQYHDIGKIEIDDAILNKPTPLSNSEYELMKEHAIRGKSLILENFSAEVYEIIQQHHERFNGSGYPKGLHGFEICEEARILAICDSFDAMISDRVYKRGKSKEDAYEEIASLSGILYDPELVQLFLELFRD